MVWKILPLEICKIFGLLGNMLTAYDKYAVRENENFLTHVQMQLS